MPFSAGGVEGFLCGHGSDLAAFKCVQTIVGFLRPRFVNSTLGRGIEARQKTVRHLCSFHRRKR
jgi:hypothetical protein